MCCSEQDETGSDWTGLERGSVELGGGGSVVQRGEGVRGGAGRLKMRGRVGEGERRVGCGRGVDLEGSDAGTRGRRVGP